MVIVGAQWGDEGKGKVTDYYGSRFSFVGRFQGGNNAGHTIVHRGQVLKLHLLPSGVLHRNCTIVVGNGVVLDPRVLFEELAQLKALGVTPKLLISERAHVIFPFHIRMDDVSETSLKQKNLAALSTKRGIWPTYSDKMARVGVRVVDLLHRGLFRKKFDLLYDVQVRKLRMLYNFRGRLRPKEVIFEAYLKKGQRLKPYVADVSLVLNRAYEQGKRILFEGAQGAMLDVDHGLYPYTTSSNTTVGGVCTGTGVPPQKIDRVVGVVKAYLSRVGGGYLPSELTNELGNRIREVGQEYGTTTGRPRRIGWLDLVQLRFAARVNGVTSLALTKVDTLNDLGPIQVCVAYRCGKQLLREMPADLTVYEKCQPVYRTFAGWKGGYGKVRSRRQLPLNLRRYLSFIEAEVGVPIELVSIGPGRESTIVRR